MARIQSEVNEVRMALERDRTLWHSRMDTMEMAVEQTLELVQEVRFVHVRYLQTNRLQITLSLQHEPHNPDPRP